MIRANAHKYSISALCRCLGIARSTYYYECKGRIDDPELEKAVQVAYDENRCVYGQRKGWIVSRRLIGRIMRKRGPVSAYTCKKYRSHQTKSNVSPVPNLLGRDFNAHEPGACIVSDLTYVRVGDCWSYICLLLDLGAREIVGYSAGRHKGAVGEESFRHRKEQPVEHPDIPYRPGQRV